MELKTKDLEGKISNSSNASAKATLTATAISLVGGAAAGLVCKYVDVNAETTEALKDTALALTVGFGAGAAYLGLKKMELNAKVEILKNHALNYAYLMSGMVGSYFIM